MQLTQDRLKTLTDYLLSKTSADQGFHSALSSPNHRVGLVLSERLVNMPVQVMAPMYRMLSEEIDEANQEVRLCLVDTSDAISCRVKHIHSRTISSCRACTVCRGKKRKACLPNDIRSGTGRRWNKVQYTGSIQKTTKSSKCVCRDAFGDADPTQHATHTVTYAFTDAPPRDAESVGLDVAGRAMLVPAEEFKALVKHIEETYAVGA